MFHETRIHNVNIVSEHILPTPAEIRDKLPVSDAAQETVLRGRLTTEDILTRRDHRLLCVVGPCSIHDLKAARDYAVELNELAKEVSDTLFIVMRVYFEKPRTTVGWKGFINDPFLDDSFRIDEGLFLAREFLLQLAELGLPAGTEVLDPITPQYLAELISWSAIGARTTESQTHREIASGLSAPVGFKNGTNGSVEVAINALESASQAHHFLGITLQGQCAVFQTKGNPCAHIVLRGGTHPNYDSVSVADCEEKLRKAKLRENIMIDCSHGNSLKDYSKQAMVLRDVAAQIKNGNRSIIGMMLESNLAAGNQSLDLGLENLRYGVSITDGCMDWQTTATLLREVRSTLKDVLPNRLA